MSYTPTTDEVRAEFIQNKGFRKPTDWDGYQEFNRWLAALIREAKAEAWDDGHAAGRDYQGDGWNSDAHDSEDDNPYREGSET